MGGITEICFLHILKKFKHMIFINKIYGLYNNVIRMNSLFKRNILRKILEYN